MATIWREKNSKIVILKVSFQNTKINSETIVPRIQTIFTGSVNDMGEYFLDPSEELPNLIGTHQLCSCVENLQYIFIIQGSDSDPGAFIRIRHKRLRCDWIQVPPQG